MPVFKLDFKRLVVDSRPLAFYIRGSIAVRSVANLSFNVLVIFEFDLDLVLLGEGELVVFGDDLDAVGQVVSAYVPSLK